MEPSKQLKQIFQMEPDNIVKSPNWPEANHLAIYKRGQGFELRATEKQIKVVVWAAVDQTRDRWISSPTQRPLGQQ